MTKFQLGAESYLQDKSLIILTYVLQHWLNPLKDGKWDEEEEGHGQGRGHGQTSYAHVEFDASIILIT